MQSLSPPVAAAVSSDANAPQGETVAPVPLPWLIRWPETWVAVISLSALIATVAAVARPGSAGLFLPLLCLGATILAAVFDAATGRIPNPVTYTAILLGVALNGLAPLVLHAAPRIAAGWLGAAGVSQSLHGLLIFGGIGLVGVIFAGMGGGDMKLLAAIGAMLGVGRATESLLVGLAVAIVYSLINLIIAGRLNAIFRAAACQMLDVIFLKRWTSLNEKIPAQGRWMIPQAIPLLIGMVLGHVPAVARFTTWLMNPGS